jgi:DNA-binding transcriptional ArsR family regulator
LTDENFGTTTNPEVEMKKVHELYLRAVNSPLRRNILGVLNEGNCTIAELGEKTQLDMLTLKWHLSVLESGLCVEKEDKQGELVYKLTQYGKVVNYIE